MLCATKAIYLPSFCETCVSGHAYWFDFSCLRCKARHYVLILTERERVQVRAKIRAEGAERLEEFRRLVEEERSREKRGAGEDGARRNIDE